MMQESTLNVMNQICKPCKVVLKRLKKPWKYEAITRARLYASKVPDYWTFPKKRPKKIIPVDFQSPKKIDYNKQARIQSRMESLQLTPPTTPPITTLISHILKTSAKPPGPIYKVWELISEKKRIETSYFEEVADDDAPHQHKNLLEIRKRFPINDSEPPVDIDIVATATKWDLDYSSCLCLPLFDPNPDLDFD